MFLHFFVCRLFVVFCVWSILGSKGQDDEEEGTSPMPTTTARPSDPFVKNEIDPKHLRGARWELKLVNPINIYFTIDILAISQISVVNSDFRLDLNLKQRWTEESLIVPKGLFEDFEPQDTQITTDGDVLDDLWTPDVYMPNSRQAQIKSLTKKHMSVQIFKNKTIVYVTNVAIVLGCPMDFNWYPLDTQYCKLILESYSYPSSKVMFQWENTSIPVVLPKNFILRQFTLRIPLNTNSSQRDRFGRNDLYSCLSVDFTLQRQLGHHLIQVFMPTFLIVAFSWFSFWLGLDAIPGRVSLLVTCLLTLVTMYTGMKTDLPPVAYIKMMDIWMAGCLGFVFAAMFEFVTVRYLAKHKKAVIQQPAKEKPPPRSVEEHASPCPYNEFYRNRVQMGNHFKNKAWDAGIHDDDFPYDLDGWQQNRRNKIGQSWNLPAYYNDFFRRNPYNSNNKLNFSKNEGVTEKPVEKKGKPTWEIIDNISRFGFPLLFACFMAVYWPILLFGSS